MRQISLIVRTALVVLAATAASLVVNSPAVANPAVLEIGADPGLGFNLIQWYNFDVPATPADEGAPVWQNSIQSIYNAGFREVSLSPVRFFDTTTYAIPLTTTQGAGLGAIQAAVVKAKSLGMKVTLNPFVEPMGFNGWRGTYNPPVGAQADTFWTDYQAYMLAVAQIGEANGADMMTVGTEYNAIDGDSGNNARWGTLIGAIDNVFHGKLGYASNWDHYNNANVQAAIWENPAIDFLGIDSYFNNVLTGYLRFQNPALSNNQANTMANTLTGNSGAYPNQTFIDLMTNAWKHKLDDEILPYAAARKGGAGMPVVFTEVGYLPYDRTARQPQGEGRPLDTDEQIMAFEALIKALDGKLDKFTALHIWQWGMPGSDGSLWNISDRQISGNHYTPNNLPLGQWLSNLAKNAVVVPEPSGAMLAVCGAAAGLRRRRARSLQR